MGRQPEPDAGQAALAGLTGWFCRAAGRGLQGVGTGLQHAQGGLQTCRQPLMSSGSRLLRGGSALMSCWASSFRCAVASFPGRLPGSASGRHQGGIRAAWGAAAGQGKSPLPHFQRGGIRWRLVDLGPRGCQREPLGGGGKPGTGGKKLLACFCICSCICTKRFLDWSM